MKNFLKSLAIFYIILILVFIFIPFSIIWKLISTFFNDNSKNSFFTDLKNHQKINFFGVNFFTFKIFVLTTLLFPSLFLLKNFNEKNFKTSKKKKVETPKQVGLLINNQLMENIKQILSKSEKNGINYFFALQPNLFYTGARADDDSKLLEFRDNNLHKGFYFRDYYKEYYNNIKSCAHANEEIKNRFIDLSEFFKNKKEQRFIDPVHFGNIGQDECAKKISDIILSAEQKKSNK